MVLKCLEVRHALCSHSERLAALSPRAALAFGSGIPGYDINEKARDAQRKAIKDELGEQKELARLEKERRRAARAAEEAAAEAARN